MRSCIRGRVSEFEILEFYCCFRGDLKPVYLSSLCSLCVCSPSNKSLSQFCLLFRGSRVLANRCLLNWFDLSRFLLDFQELICYTISPSRSKKLMFMTIKSLKTSSYLPDLWKIGSFNRNNSLLLLVMLNKTHR